MPTSASTMRRGCGVLFLALAFGMLIAGRAVFDEKLKGVGFLVYWCFCFLFTFGAMITALLDIRATRRAAQQEQQDLLDQTMDDIDRQSKPEGRDRKRSDT